MYDVYHILVPFCLYVYCTAPDKLLSRAWGLYPQKKGWGSLYPQKATVVM